MAMDDDDDDVGLDAGEQEPAGDPTASVAAAGQGITAVIPVRSGARPISDNVRKAFATAMAKAKAIGEDEGGLEPMDHDDLPAEAAPVVKPEGGEVAILGTDAPVPAVAPAPVIAPVAVAPVAPVITAPAAPVIPPQPPAPSLDPEVVRMRADLEQQRKDFDAERLKFAADSRTTDIAKLRDTYFDKGAPAIVEVVKQWMPGIEGEDLKREVADLIQDLAHQYLEAPLEDSVKDRITNKRVRAGLKTWRQDQEHLEQEKQKQLLASQEAQNQIRVKGILHQEVTKPEHVTQFPWLSSEANAGDIVYEVIDQEYRSSGQQLTWQDAAKRADTWLQQQALAFVDKRKHLLSPPPPPSQQPAPSEQQRTQGDNQVRRSHAPPKQDKPAELPRATAVQNGKWSPEQHRRNTMSKFKDSLKSLADDE